MRIQSITSQGLYNKPIVKQEKPQQNPNFLGTLDAKQLKKLDLDKKLEHLFSNCRAGDLVAVGKNFQEVYSGLRRSVKDFGEIIKRILFIKHGGLAVPMAFAIENDEDWICTNIGDKNFLISSLDDVDEVSPTESYALDEGDIIINNNVNIPIGIFADYSEYLNDIDDMELLMNPENFATKVFDLDNVQQKWIQNANTEVLSTLEIEKDKQELKEQSHKKLTFADVGGMAKTVDEIKKSVLYPIKFPFAYENVAVNKGILLYGKPGTGKTLLAEALAGESDAHFIKLSGTDFESKWVGETESKWRELFKDARDNQPSIIFIDEFDAVVRERGQSVNAQHSDKIVNQILSLMSDLEKSNDNVFVIATTNKPENIDSAMKRSGRFGKQIEVKAPDEEGLQDIWNIHSRGKSIDPSFDKNSYIKKLASRHFTGADIKHVINEAHTKSWNRAGIYEKMDNGTLTPEDLHEVFINSEDFESALVDWDSNKKVKTVNKIGFSEYKK